MKPDLVLVTLNPEQIEKAKMKNGSRKRITHALLCGPYGQMFGTEKQCLKYYSVWSDIFRSLFSKSTKTCEHEISNYSSTFNLVNILIRAHDKLAR